MRIIFRLFFALIKRAFIVLLLFIVISIDIEAKQPQKGYRGFVDWSNDVRGENLYGHKELHRTYFFSGISTTHGYQFNSWLFTGLGINYEYSSKAEEHILAPYIDLRSDLKLGKFTPFGDLRIGYSLTNCGGLYFSPTIGYRLSIGNKLGVNLGAGITLKGYNHEILYIDPSLNSYQPMRRSDEYWTEYKVSFAFRLGLDF